MLQYYIHHMVFQQKKYMTLKLLLIDSMYLGYINKYFID